MVNEGNTINHIPLPIGYFRLGFYPLGNEVVQVVSTPLKGEGHFIPSDGLKFAQIYFGPPMSEAMPPYGVLIHEVMEFLMVQKGVSYDPTDLLTPDTSNRMFMMNNAQLGRIAVDLALFLKAFFEGCDRNSPVPIKP